ncbi:MAG: nitroreductase [Frankia sp.]|nr:nitroreductase [Frankia sp.]
MVTTPGLPVDLVRDVVRLAGLAPSIHNTQPWRWRHDGAGLYLYPEPARLLAVLDPTGRQLLLSCGAALLHARVALRARGLEPRVELGPLADGPVGADSPLATIRVVGAREASAEELALAAAIERRHTDRRPFQPVPLAHEDVVALRRAAEAEGSWLRSFDDPQLRVEVAVLLAHADWIETHDPAYREELGRWRRQAGGAADGIPPSAVVSNDERQSEFVLRDFEITGDAGLPLGQVSVERPTVVGIGSSADTPADRLMAGQALGRVLLTATARGAAASPLGQAVDLPSTRALLGAVAGGLGHIQMLLRVGYPQPQAAPLAPTPRRAVDEILETTPDAPA